MNEHPKKSRVAQGIGILVGVAFLTIIGSIAIKSIRWALE